MLDLLRSIIDTVVLLVSFVLNMIQSLLNFILMIPTYITFVSSLLGVVPAFATAFFAAGISLTVILFVIGRQSD